MLALNKKVRPVLSAQSHTCRENGIDSKLCHKLRHGFVAVFTKDFYRLAVGKFDDGNVSIIFYHFCGHPYLEQPVQGIENYHNAEAR